MSGNSNWLNPFSTKSTPSANPPSITAMEARLQIAEFHITHLMSQLKTAVDDIDELKREKCSWESDKTHFSTRLYAWRAAFLTSAALAAVYVAVNLWYVEYIVKRCGSDCLPQPPKSLSSDIDRKAEPQEQIQ